MRDQGSFTGCATRPLRSRVVHVFAAAAFLAGCAAPVPADPSGGIRAYEGCPLPYPEGPPAPCTSASIRGTVGTAPTGWVCTSSADFPALDVSVLREPTTGRLGIQYDQREIPVPFAGIAAVPDGASSKLVEWSADSPVGFVEIPGTAGNEVRVLFYQADLEVVVDHERIETWEPIWSMWRDNFWMDLLVHEGERTYAFRPMQPFAWGGETTYDPASSRWTGPDFQATLDYRTTGTLSLLADGVNVCPTPGIASAPRDEDGGSRLAATRFSAPCWPRRRPHPSIRNLA